jgi:uncharacterized protein YjiS (DUF1127 family)
MISGVQERIGKFFRMLAVWRDRAEKRRILGRMSDRQLKDIGATRIDALREIRKPFWIP